ncbi:MAG: hypothetical protein ACKN81_01270, partial [Pirellulaceae bacterium]
MAFDSASSCAHRPSLGRITIWTMLLAAGLVAAVGGPIAAQSDDGPTKDAIGRAIDFLLTQQKESGAITMGQHDTAMTALSIMAMASVGTTASDPTPRGKSMRRALDFVLQDDRRNKEGYFGEKDGSRMYGHGITTLMLSEMLGMGADREQDEKIELACRDGIDLILKAQRRNKQGAYRGGWRYTPDAAESD